LRLEGGRIQHLPGRLRRDSAVQGGRGERHRGGPDKTAAIRIDLI
jgi:hypothetical protein